MLSEQKICVDVTKKIKLCNSSQVLIWAAQEVGNEKIKSLNSKGILLIFRQENIC